MYVTKRRRRGEREEGVGGDREKDGLAQRQIPVISALGERGKATALFRCMEDPGKWVRRLQTIAFFGGVPDWTASHSWAKKGSLPIPCATLWLPITFLHCLLLAFSLRGLIRFPGLLSLHWTHHFIDA